VAFKAQLQRTKKPGGKAGEWLGNYICIVTIFTCYFLKMELPGGINFFVIYS